ncbi:50S ribosomal protein L11 methyltransferase [Fructilactobacillus sp. Tb1]|uniref:50S ribosomal protein L11 methyltransferase n=1 Tax=Fructilactobacillus sp. Tb1 TaxID=3422304 RepID=UPI003D2CB4CE
MNLIEVKVITTQEAVPAVSNILMEQNAQGIQIDDAKGDGTAAVITYFPDDVDIKTIKANVEAKTKNLTEFGLNPGAAKVLVDDIEEKSWAYNWEDYYHAERITRYLTIVPAWEDYKSSESDQLIIKLDPGMAFGTGTHPTTKMSMQALEATLRGGEKLFDVGTGSGVLSIAARLLGAGEIEAWDNDPIAVASTKKNFDLNPGMNDIKVSENSLLEGIKGKADVIVANMLAEVLIPLVPQAAEHLDKGGKFITAGIYADKLAIMLETLKDSGFTINQVTSADDWRSIIATKGE